MPSYLDNLGTGAVRAGGNMVGVGTNFIPPSAISSTMSSGSAVQMSKNAFSDFDDIADAGKTLDNVADAGKTLDNVADTGKTVSNVALDAGKTASNVASDTGGSVGNAAAGAGKSADNAATGAGKSVDNAATGAGKSADDQAKLLKNADDEADAAANQAGKQSPSEILTKKNALAGVATIGGIAASAIASDNYFKKNGKIYNIISIDDKSIDSTIKTQITIQSEDKLAKKDKIDIQNTNCIPVLVGNFIIEEVISKDKIIIITPNKITTKGTAGTFTYYTTFQRQFAEVLKDGVKSTGQGVGQGVKEVIQEGLSSLLEGLGISSEKMWIVYLIIGCIVALLIYKIIRFFV